MGGPRARDALADAVLYTFVDTGYLRGRSPAEVARQLCAGGADLIQLRAKGVPVAEVRRLAEELLPITHRAGVALVINDQWAVAAAVGAPFGHLGQEDFFAAGRTHVSELAPAAAPGWTTPRLGLSTHSADQAQRALAAGAAYLGVGPVYATPTKPGVAPVTLKYVQWAAANVPSPWFAIGGITLVTLDAVLAAGARRVCVVSAILDAPNLVQACEQFKRRLLSAAPATEPGPNRTTNRPAP